MHACVELSRAINMHSKATRVLPLPTSPLQQAIHLPARSHIGPDLLDHPLLRSRQFERHAFPVESIEIMADVGNRIPPTESFRRRVY